MPITAACIVQFQASWTRLEVNTVLETDTQQNSKQKVMSLSFTTDDKGPAVGKHFGFKAKTNDMQRALWSCLHHKAAQLTYSNTHKIFLKNGQQKMSPSCATGSKVEMLPVQNARRKSRRSHSCRVPCYKCGLIVTTHKFSLIHTG